MDGKPAEVDTGGSIALCNDALSRVGETKEDIEYPNLGSFLISGFGFLRGRYL